jgi:hypothetical protein
MHIMQSRRDFLARAFSYCVESAPVIRQYRLRPRGCDDAGTDFLGPSAADRARGRAWQHDPRSGPALRRQPVGRIKLMQRVRTTGSAAPARYGGHRRPRLEPHEADLRRLVEATPDSTLAELQADLQRRFGIVAALSTIHNALRRIGLRHKKSP